jgi:hypothetical protein
MLAAGLAARRIHRRLRLRLYGISVQALDRYCRQVHSAGSLQAERLVYRAERPHAQDATPTQRLTGHTLSDHVAVDPVAVPSPSPLTPGPCRSTIDSLSRRFLDRLAGAIEDPELTPEQLSRLAISFAQQHQAFLKARAQTIADRRFAFEHAELRAKAKARKERSQDTLEDRVRRIYGFDMPKANPTPMTPAPPGKRSHQ